MAVPVEDSVHSLALLRGWKKDTTDPQAAWTVETAEWGVKAFEAPLRIDPTTDLPVTAIAGENHPIPSLSLLRRLP